MFRILAFWDAARLRGVNNRFREITLFDVFEEPMSSGKPSFMCEKKGPSCSTLCIHSGKLIWHWILSPISYLRFVYLVRTTLANTILATFGFWVTTKSTWRHAKHVQGPTGM